jgi:hypothetical protein
MMGPSSREVSPFGQSGGAVLFESLAAVQVALVIEIVVERGMDGDKFLEGAGVPELSHRFLPSSRWLVIVFSAIVKPPAAFLADSVANTPHRCTV